MKALIFYSDRQLLPILNKALLFHYVDALLQAGITEIGIVIDSMKNYLWDEINRSEYRSKANITLIKPKESSGLIPTMLSSRAFINNDGFAVITGNAFFQADLREAVLASENNKGQLMIALKAAAKPPRYAFVIENDQVKSIRTRQERPVKQLMQAKEQSQESRWALSGLYFCQPSTLEVFDRLQLSEDQDYEIIDLIQPMIDYGYGVQACFPQGSFQDIASFGDLWEANMQQLKEEAENIAALPCKTIFSRVKQPALIHKTAVILNSVIGPNVVVGRNAYIKNSHLENSVVLRDSSIRNVQAKNSVLSPWGIEKINPRGLEKNDFL